MSTIVSDASPLIALSRINQLELISQLFEQVFIPPAVMQEIVHPEKPGGISFESLPWLIERELENLELLESIDMNLHPGERAAIALAHQLDNDLLMDEALGRKEANKLGVQVKGTIGLLLKAKDESLIPQIKPLVENLIRTGFWISTKFYEEALQRANELE